MKPVSRCRAWCLLLFLFSAILCADAADDYVKAEMERQKIPGLSLAVVHYSRFPDDKVSVIVFTDGSEAKPRLIVEGVARLYCRRSGKRRDKIKC